jgi:phenylpropionate dioxygenase-like ring-hydroxylating dioxygenase large terminal subunit
VAIICGTLLYGTFYPNSSKQQQEIVGNKIAQLLREENAQKALKNLQNEIIDQLRAIVEQQAKKVRSLAPPHFWGVFLMDMDSVL